jgi:hypothetical protein
MITIKRLLAIPLGILAVVAFSLSTALATPLEFPTGPCQAQSYPAFADAVLTNDLVADAALLVEDNDKTANDAKPRTLSEVAAVRVNDVASVAGSDAPADAIDLNSTGAAQGEPDGDGRLTFAIPIG